MMNCKTRETVWALGISLMTLLLCTSGAIAQVNRDRMTEKQIVSKARKLGKPAYIAYTIADDPECPTCPKIRKAARKSASTMIKQYIGKRYIVGVVSFKNRGELYAKHRPPMTGYLVISPAAEKLFVGSNGIPVTNTEVQAWAKEMNNKAAKWPVMPYSTISGLKKSFVRARKQIANNQYIYAQSLIPTARKVWYPKEFVEECTAFRKELATHGPRLLEEAAALTEEGKKLDAAMAYVFINSQFKQQTETGAKSRKQLGELMRYDEALKKQVPILERKQRAETQLAMAEELESKERTKRAIFAYKNIAKAYGDIDAGKKAQAAADRLAQTSASTKKPASTKKATSSTPAQKAARMMRLAKTYREQRLNHKAKETLDQLIAKYPDTEVATEARKLKETW
jgi:hypothetical protein